MDQLVRTQGTSAAAREGGEIHPPVHRRGEVAVAPKQPRSAVSVAHIFILIPSRIVLAPLRRGSLFLRSSPGTLSLPKDRLPALEFRFLLSAHWLFRLQTKFSK